MQENSLGKHFYSTSHWSSPVETKARSKNQYEVSTEVQPRSNLDFWEENHLRLRKNAIHVRNLPLSADRDSLFEHFKGFGRISTIEIAYRESLFSKENGKHSKYCLVLTKDTNTYKRILNAAHHVYRGTSLLCTPCVKGSRSLVLLGKLMSPTRVLLLAKPPTPATVTEAELRDLLAPEAVLLPAKHLLSPGRRETSSMVVTVRSLQEARRLIDMKSLTRSLGTVAYSFEIRPFGPLESESAYIVNNGEQKLDQARENCISNAARDEGWSDSRTKCVFPPYHRLLPCRKNYYTKRVRFGGSELSHTDAGLRFNQSAGLLWQSVPTQANSPEDPLESELVETPSEFECGPTLSVEESERTITPRKEDELRRTSRQSDARETLVPATQ